MTRNFAPIELKPRDLGENLGLLFQLSGRHYLPVFLVYTVVALPNVALSLLMLELGKGADPADTEAIVTGAIGTLAQAAISMLVTPFAIGVSIFLVSASFTGHHVTLREAIVATWHRFLALIGYTFTTGLLIGLAAMLVAIPIVLLYVLQNAIGSILALMLIVPSLIPACMLITRFYVGPCAVTLEECGVMDAIRRSQELTRRRGWQVFGLWIIMTIVVGMVPGFGAGILAATGTLETPIGQIGLWLMQTAISVFTVVGPVVMYFSLRCEKEHFDVAVLADLVDRIAADHVGDH